MSENKVSQRRAGYDKRHPVISFRISEDDHNKLKQLLEKENKSIGQFFREALEIEERNYREARSAGYSKGFKVAKEKYAIVVSCCECGQPISVSDPCVREMISMQCSPIAHSYHFDSDEPTDAKEMMLVRADE